MMIPQRSALSPLLPLMALLLAGCIHGAGSGPQAISVKGRMFKGPACPGYARSGHPCPDVPVSALFHILDAGGSLLASFESDENGRFSLRLPPGTYTVVPDASSGLLPILPGNTKTVVVAGGTCATLDLHFNTGMH
jgi:hypothetical protein